MRRAVCAVLALLALTIVRSGSALSAQAPADTTSSDSVTLTFNWPVGMQADVIVRRTQVRHTGARGDTTDAAARYRLVVKPHERGLLVAYEDFQLVGTPPAGADAGTVARAMEQVTAVFPSYVVSAGGEYQGLHDVAGNVAAARRLLQPILDSALRVQPDARGLFDALLSEDLFTRRAAEDWNALVGLWVGATFTLGETYETESVEPVPVLPDLKIPFTYEFSLLGRVPCVEDQPMPECVELAMTSFPDPDSMRTMLTALLGRLGGPALGQGVFDSLDVENTITLIADPATLRPYWLEVTQEVWGTGREGGGAPQSFSQMRRRQYDFAYAPRRDPRPYEPPGADVFRVAAGTWGWSRGRETCRANPHTVAFTAARDTMVITFREEVEADSTRLAREFRYAIQNVTGGTIRASLKGETRRTDAGEPVIWDLVLTSPDSYRWHRADWPADAYTGSVVRCGGP